MSEVSRKDLVHLIADVVARHYALRISDIYGRTRLKSYAEARQVVMFAARTLCKMSYPEIGRRLENRDHTTVMSGVDVIDRRRQTDVPFREKLGRIFEELEEKLGVPGGPGASGVWVPLSGLVLDRLVVLVQSGCFGDNISEAAERILSAQLYELVGEECVEVMEE